MKKQVKLMAVLSTAALMSAVAPAFFTAGGSGTVFAQETGWVNEDGEWRYYEADGYYMTDSWKKRDNEWYYLNDEGYVAKNERIDEYYVDENGKRVINQWVSIDNEEDWDSSTPDSYWYYFGRDGKALVSKWLTLDGNQYYLNADGHMQTGKAEIDGFTYYFGAEDDGIMKTGWVQMTDEAEDPDSDFVWHFFDNKGKMVINQVDRRIDGNYYSFEDGILQTGWYKLPASETSTASDAASANVAGYQYYEEDGKRASGWYQIEGVPSISEEGEIYRFYFKNGAPYYAKTGIQTFSIDSKRYAFNTKGEMQTGLQVVTFDDGDLANCYFGTDGIMRTGKQVIFDEEEGENRTWFFHANGEFKGRGFHGIRDNVIYEYGLRQEADSDLRYSPVAHEGNNYLVNVAGTIQKASASSKSATRPELGTGFKDIKDSNDKIWVVNTNGIIQ